jgi:hypothetical protein
VNASYARALSSVFRGGYSAIGAILFSLALRHCLLTLGCCLPLGFGRMLGTGAAAQLADSICSLDLALIWLSH